MLKTSKSQESIEFSAPQSYRHRHAHPLVRCRFPALVPAAQPHFTGTRTRRLAASVDRPAPATPWPAPSLRASGGLTRLRRLNFYHRRTAVGRYCVVRRQARLEHMRGVRITRDREAANLDVRLRFASFGRSGTVLNALAAVGIALRDIAGKASGEPLPNQLGGAKRSRLPVMASLEALSTGLRRRQHRGGAFPGPTAEKSGPSVLADRLLDFLWDCSSLGHQQ